MIEFLIVVVSIMVFQLGAAVGKADRMYYEKCKTQEQTECWKSDKS